jgi:hypothetical protein
MASIEFEGFDAKTTKALKKKVAAVSSGATMKQETVVAFLQNVDDHGQDLREEVHGCTLDELTEQLAVLAAIDDLGVSYNECAYLAGRLREIVRHPGA